MVKVISLISVILGCSSFGYIKYLETKDRVRYLTDYRDLIHKLATEISYFKMPLPEIFSSMQHQLLNICSKYYELEGFPLDVAFAMSIDEYYPKNILTVEDKEILKKVGYFIGQSNWLSQEEHFKLVNMELNQQIEEAKTIISTKGNVYKKMGISIGIVIAIIFI